MKKILLFLTLLPILLYAQRDLKPVTDAASSILNLTGKGGSKVKKAAVSSETGVTMDLSMELEGFKRDKKYKIKGEVLSKTKLKVREVEPVTVDVNNSSTTAEMTFKFNTSATTSYTDNKVESGFVRLTLTEVDERLGDLLGDTGLNSSEFLFECKKEWRVKGSATNNSIIVEVKLVPLKSAATIQQFSN